MHQRDSTSGMVWGDNTRGKTEVVVEVTGRMHKIGNEPNEWWLESPLWRPLM